MKTRASSSLFFLTHFFSTCWASFVERNTCLRRLSFVFETLRSQSRHSAMTNQVRR